jgi:hypothetical protein
MKKSGLLIALASLFLAACSSTTEVSTEKLKQPFADNRSQVDACYVKVMKKQPDIGEGTVEMKFLINEDGNAYKTVFMKKRSTLSNKLLNACIKKVVHSWQFPSGKALEVVYPFQFEKQSTTLSPESSAPVKMAKPAPKAAPKPVEKVESAPEPKGQADLDVIDTSPPEDETEAEGEETPAE